MSDSVRPHRRQPTRLPSPWDSPGKNTGVGCHFLLQCMKVKSESEVGQSCPTLSDLMDCSPPGSSVHGIFQARVLEWGAIAFAYQGYKDPKDDSFPLTLSFMHSSPSVTVHTILSFPCFSSTWIFSSTRIMFPQALHIMQHTENVNIFTTHWSKQRRLLTTRGGQGLFCPKALPCCPKAEMVNVSCNTPSMRSLNDCPL